MNIQHYISDCHSGLLNLSDYNNPWHIVSELERLIQSTIKKLSTDQFLIENNIAIHKSATVEDHVSIKEFTIIDENSVVKSGAYLRSGVYIGKGVSIGANSELKQSIIFNKSRIAHLNYVGNSIIGEDVNLEAGSILANHFNEFNKKEIQVLLDDMIIDTHIIKFGSLIGDYCRIGANAVLNPGTILRKSTIIGRLTHVDQLKDHSTSKS